MFGLSAEFVIDFLGTLGFGFLFAGAFWSFVSGVSVFWSKKIKWILASLSFFLSAASFLALAWFIPVFAWDVVPLALADFSFLALCLPMVGVK